MLLRYLLIACAMFVCSCKYIMDEIPRENNRCDVFGADNQEIRMHPARYYHTRCKECMGLCGEDNFFTIQNLIQHVAV